MSRISIIGGTGLVGSKIVEASLLQGHETAVISRARSEKNRDLLDQFEGSGAEIQFSAADDVGRMATLFRGVDAVICTVAGEVDTIRSIEYPLLEAAKQAGVKRFLPNEFGLDTLRIPEEAGALFDVKKEFRAALQESGVPFTAIFNGGIFDYLLPNLREYDAITTFGDRLDVPYYTHARDDIGAIAVMASLDPRCENQYVHLKYNLVTQGEVLEKLYANFPGTDFPTAKITEDEILDGTHEVKTAIWINGHCGLADPRCLDPKDLYPGYEWVSVDQALSDPQFVFGESN